MAKQVTTDEYFGGCPRCGKNDGYLNVGRWHWFYCAEHKTKWCAGSNLFSSWQNEAEEDQERVYNKVGLGEFAEVEPIYPEKNMTDIDDMDVGDSMRALLDANVDLTDRAAVEAVLINPYRGTTESERFVDWCIKAAKANQAAGGLERHVFGNRGFVPKE
jgi:hypothetical protein